LDSCVPLFSWSACALKHHSYRSSRYHRFECFLRGPPLGGAKRGFACTPREGARDAASFRRTRHNSPHRTTSHLSPLTLLPKPVEDFSSTAENCTDGGGLASSPLPRIVVGEAVPRIVGAQASGRISTAACKMSVSTLNPHLVQLISLLTVRRRASSHA
jgi:hypothetical protein